MKLTVQEILEDLHAAEIDCQRFEKKYGILTEYFYSAYTNGSLEDNGNPDYALWAGAYEVKLDREEIYRNLIVIRSPLFTNLPNLKFEDVEY
ncbi:MAG: hypothetical protein JW729_00115 [Bacteroidales bacterium]|nr:hypothetical protein [Bacteroidales bacterium]